jgi:hypothetical protein
MNEELKGYRTRVPYAHLQLLTGVVTLESVTVVQNAHPKPPVATIRLLRARLQLRELLWRKVVATFLLYRPRIHINLAQLKSETSNKVPIRQEGWQQALEAVYPFKVNHLKVVDGDFTYLDPNDPNRPLHLEHLYVDVDNIRNIHSPDRAFPSPIRVRTRVFGRGRLQIDGHANFLAEPFPGIHAIYSAKDIPLSQFDPEIQRANLRLTGGTMDSRGEIEYSPRIRRVEVYDAHIDDVSITYIHSPDTQDAEKKRIETAKKVAQQAANEPELMLKVDQLEIANSRLAYTDWTQQPGYTLFISELALRVTNLSNHASEGVSHVELRGKLMGSGKTAVSGNFRPNNHGPDFDLNASAEGVDLSALNALLAAKADVNVKSGKVSVYLVATVRNGELRAVVKPLFEDRKVYNPQAEKNRSLLHKTKEVAIGGAGKIFKNRSTQKVATAVPITGRLDSPNTSTWQAIAELARNAFVQAIRPGFDRDTQPSAS